MTTALVGPLPTVRFEGGCRGGTEMAVPQAPPRNTMDVRFAVCRNHHLACDCREALLAEESSEMASEMKAVMRALDAATEGHLVQVYDERGEYLDAAACHCGVCSMLRENHLTHLVLAEKRFARVLVLT